MPALSSWSMDASLRMDSTYAQNLAPRDGARGRHQLGIDLRPAAGGALRAKASSRATETRFMACLLCYQLGQLSDDRLISIRTLD